MDRTEVLATTVSMARVGVGFTPAAALDCIAAMIGEEDPRSISYDAHVDRLLRVAACIWMLRHEKYLPAVSQATSSRDPDPQS